MFLFDEANIQFMSDRVDEFEKINSTNSKNYKT